MVDNKKASQEIEKSNKKALNFLGLTKDEFSQVSKKTSGKILAIDYGTKNIGLAISDQRQQQAFVYGTLRMSRKLFDKIKAICVKEMIDKIIIGLPLGLHGEYTDKTNETIYFSEALEKQIGLIVETQDERLSTVEALKLNDGQGRDESAARIILQQYLDSHYVD